MTTSTGVHYYGKYYTFFVYSYINMSGKKRKGLGHAVLCSGPLAQVCITECNFLRLEVLTVSAFVILHTESLCLGVKGALSSSNLLLVPAVAP
jgi:hypothetical protein